MALRSFCEKQCSSQDIVRTKTRRCTWRVHRGNAVSQHLNSVPGTPPLPSPLTLATVAGLVSAADKLSGTSQLSDSVALQPLSVASCGSSAPVSSPAVIEDIAPNTECRVPSAGRRTQDVERRTPDSGRRTPSAECRAPDAGRRSPGTGHRVPDVEH